MRRSRRSLKRVWGLLPLFLLVACAVGQPQVRRELATGSPSIAVSRDETIPAGTMEEGPRAGLQVVLVSGTTTPDASGTRKWQPLTVSRLVELAREKGIGVGCARVECNRQIGMAFQTAVSRCLEVAVNFRAFPTSVRTRHKAVIPDGLIPALKLSSLGRFNVHPEGAFLEVVGDEVLELLEVKARLSRITLSTSHRQIQGLIDVLAQLERPRGSLLSAVSPTPRRALLLVTTADTEVSADVAWEAAQCGVALFQARTQEAEGLVSVGPFVQRTSFADVPQQFQWPVKPMPLGVR